ncbi:hypothetical protein C5167_040365 [Papaver somniferum]|uniref:Amino acid transporter transmembrane domain-containing protein n=1 Tax=Papaver somniferum TaxID=3469 RepID=A0A4Y7IH91_PAPSO|nr:amino acid transporter AVT1H-like [Papaver somniferum]RZC47426.1 hypothetical protein C5167_040365 [Papaver somniferum]
MKETILSNGNVKQGFVQNSTGHNQRTKTEEVIVINGDNKDVNGKDLHVLEDDNRQVKANSSFLHTVLNMAGIIIGLGQLSIPYALQNGGWASAFLLVGFGMLCTYTAHLLGKCLKRNENARHYSDIGYHAFGNKGRTLTSTFIYLMVFMALVSYTISLCDNLNRIFAEKHLQIPWLHLSTSQLLTVSAVLIALPSLWVRDLSTVSLLSTAGIFMTLLIFSTVVYTAIFSGAKSNRGIAVLRLHNIPAISGLYVYCFNSHFVFPNIYKSMKDPSKFTKASIVSFALVTILYTSMAFMGAKLFGPEVKSQVTLSMPKHLIATKIALWATVLTPMTKYAIQFAPVAMKLDHKLPSTISYRARFLLRGAIGSLLLLCVLVLALLVPFFQHVLGLAGSLISMSLSIIFPCSFYTKIFWSQISKPQLVLNVVIITFGVILGAFGTVQSSKSLVQSLERRHAQ